MDLELKNAVIKGLKEQAPLDGTYVFSVDAAAKVDIKVEVIKVPHEYTNGPGDKVRQIIMAITLPDDVVLQGHDDLSSEFEEAALKILSENICGELENQD